MITIITIKALMAVIRKIIVVIIITVAIAIINTTHIKIGLI